MVRGRHAFILVGTVALNSSKVRRLMLDDEKFSYLPICGRIVRLGNFNRGDVSGNGSGSVTSEY